MSHHNKSYKISVVVPCLNEEENIHTIAERLLTELKHYSDFEIILVDDGSTDQTLHKMKEVSKDGRVKYISLARNFGTQVAMKAGIDLCSGDCLIFIDADSEHPPEFIHKMIELWFEGYEIVNAIRKENRKLSFFKRYSSKLFNRMLNSVSDIRLEEGVTDFKLIDRKVIDVARKFNEAHLFWRGIFTWIGFKQTKLYFEQNIREHGQTKFNFATLLKLAVDGITAFSTKPLYLSIYFGFAIAALAFVYGVYAIYMKAFTDVPVSGWTSILAGGMFIGGIQLVIMGIIGIYLGRLFIQSKERPSYIVNETNVHTEDGCTVLKVS